MESPWGTSRGEHGRAHPALGLAAGITAAVVAWGYLVWLAIDFGRTARDGDSGAWALLALASLGAIACLFVGLMLLSRITEGRHDDVEHEEPELAPVRRSSRAHEHKVGDNWHVPTSRRTSAQLASPYAPKIDVPAQARHTDPPASTPTPVVTPTPTPVAEPEPVAAAALAPVVEEPAAPEPVADLPAIPGPSAPAAVEDPAEIPVSPPAASALTPAAPQPAEPVAAPAPAARETFDPLGTGWTPPATTETPGSTYAGAGKRSSGRHAGGTEAPAASGTPYSGAGKRRANV